MRQICMARRSSLSAATAAFSLLTALIWLAFGRSAAGVLWIAISAGWLIAAGIQRIWMDRVEPLPAKLLIRRFTRLLFWS